MQNDLVFREICLEINLTMKNVYTISRTFKKYGAYLIYFKILQF